MQLVLQDTGVTLGGEFVPYVGVRRGVRGENLRLLDPLRTGGNPISEWDARYARNDGRFPAHQWMALNPLWFFHRGTPIAARRTFDRWLRSSARPGRKPNLSYDDVLTVRRAKKYLDLPDDIRWFIKPPAFRHIRACRTYWWVEGINPEWVGYDWTFSEDE